MKRRAAPAEPPDDNDELFAWAERQPTPAEENTIREAFERFHRANPAVYALFERFALEAIHSGADTLGAKAVWERLRWETSVQVEHRAQFKLNNNFTPYLARLFMERHPEHGDVFHTRKVRS